MSLKFTIVDQPPVTRASHKLSPVQLSDQSAQAFAHQGDRRYRLVEHHNSANFTGPRPEVLISHLAPLTKQIHVGGVM